MLKDTSRYVRVESLNLSVNSIMGFNASFKKTVANLGKSLFGTCMQQSLLCSVYLLQDVVKFLNHGDSSGGFHHRSIIFILLIEKNNTTGYLGC